MGEAKSQKRYLPCQWAGSGLTKVHRLTLQEQDEAVKARKKL
jgi:hypothetical protein